MPTTICTIVVGARGEICGAPAIVTLAGGKYGECAAHAPAGTTPEPELHVGAPVRIEKYGKIFTGTITHIARTRVEVRFTTTGGKVKTITIPMEEIL